MNLSSPSCEALDIDRGSWPIGVGLAVGTAVTVGLGVLVHRKASRITDVAMSGVVHVFGFMLYCLAATCAFASLAFAPMNVVMPCTSLVILVNGFLSDEEKDLVVILSSVAIMFGGALVTFNSERTNVVCDEEILMQMYGTPLFGGFIVGTTATAVWQFLCAPMRRLSWPSGVAFMLANAALLARALDSLVIRSTRGESLSRPETYIFSFMFAFFAVNAIIWSHRSLSIIPSVVAVPITFGVFIILSVLGSAALYHELGDLVALNAFFVSLGTFIVLIGVLALGLIENPSPEYKGLPDESVPLDDGIAI